VRQASRNKSSAASPLSARLAEPLREVAFWTLSALALYLLLSLSSYSPADPGWSHSASDAPVVNRGGPLGAWTADVLLLLLGYVGYLLPPGIAWIGWVVFHRRPARGTLQHGLPSIRAVGVMLALVAAAGLLTLQGGALEPPAEVGFAPGGAIGLEAARHLVAWVDVLGARLFLLAVLLSGVTLGTGFSWLALIDWVGRWTLRLLGLARAFAVSVGSRVGTRAAAAAAGRRAAVAEVLQTGKAAAVRALPAPGRRSASRPAVAEPSPSPEAPERVEPVIAPDDFGAAESPSFAAGADAEIEPARREPVIFDAAGSVDAAAPVGGAAPGAEAEPALDGRRPTAGMPPRARSEAPPAPARRVPRADVGGEQLSLDLLDVAEEGRAAYSEEDLELLSRQVEERLGDFGVKVRVDAVHPGPVITRFEVAPAPGVKVSQISNLSKDLARSLSVISVRVVEVIPGKSTIGLEIPNHRRQIVRLGELLQSRQYRRSRSPLSLVLGKDIGAKPVVVELAKMPHLLVAGTTGSGKSVAINAMILSLLYKAGPDQVRLIMIDPKMLELSIYEGIPHLLAPVVTDMKEAANALRWCVAEMERRYQLMAAMGVRNIGGYNRKVGEALEAGTPIADPLQAAIEGLPPPILEPLPFIVVIVDELADLMMVVGKKVEELIARLAQKARAAGLHLILATQRPSVDVITGLIKANIPTRISFQVSSRVDSRTILDQMGAETLLGQGDMLYLAPGTGIPMRVHGAFVDDHEVHNVVEALKSAGEPDYVDDVLEGGTGETDAVGVYGGGGGDSGAEQDALYDQALRIVTETRRASVSNVQRRLKIGYNRAARLVEAMEEAGVVGPLQPNGSREVLAPPPPED
jgi:S-DNA-T family DNA segregation ATPase FtsK/SpoIIIE